MYILQEIKMDWDATWSSQYMQVDMSKKGTKKLAFAAFWDSDWSFGSRAPTGTLDFDNTDWLYISELDNP